MLDTRCFYLLDAVASALLLLDEDSRIQYANPAALELFNQGLDELQGQDWDAVWFTFDLSRFGDTESWVTVEAADPNGRPRCFQFFRGELPCSPGILLTVLNRTEALRLERERERMMEMTAIGEVLPAILHELKNPFASIMSMVEVVTEDCDDDIQYCQLQSILSETRRLKLAFEGLGAVTRNLSSTRMQAIEYGMREACEALEPFMARSQIHLKNKIHGLPLLPFDAGGIRGILFNLLNNAKQASEPGDEIVVQGGLSEDPAAFWFTVTDNGTGMEPAIREQCTDLFFTTKTCGTGIGLALCKTAVERMHGSLEILSEPGRGTTVTVRLPVPPPKHMEG